MSMIHPINTFRFAFSLLIPPIEHTYTLPPILMPLEWYVCGTSRLYPIVQKLCVDAYYSFFVYYVNICVYITTTTTGIFVFLLFGLSILNKQADRILYKSSDCSKSEGGSWWWVYRVYLWKEKPQITIYTEFSDNR